MSNTSKPAREDFYRHSRLVRATHWINAVCLFFLIASGLQIFNAHPRLYWGQKGAEPERAFLAIEAERGPRGVTRIGELAFDTTGVLGLSRTKGVLESRAFPSWLTIPSWRDLAAGRRWHFFFAWIFAASGLAYLIHGFATAHIQRDLAPAPDQLSGRHLWREIRDHARLRFPKGEAAKRYNALQKISYLAIVVFFLPMMALTGLAMSPGMNAAAPFLLDLFGGRQSARTLHFLFAAAIVAFIVAHLFMVLVSGVGNNLRSMFTGRYRIEKDSP